MIIKTSIGVAGLLSLILSATGGTTQVDATTSTASQPTTTTTLVPASVMAQWRLVAQCETHQNWRFEGANYDGGLGISRTNWIAFKGTDFAPAPHLATPEEQVVVARRIQAYGGVPDFVPDQDGQCHGW